jgi:S-methylmethionine-dependent homocysteine/selenocysteine methylase
MPTLDLPHIVLLDGGMGRELRFRGVDILDTNWAANGLLVAPQIVRQIHMDYIAAGANIITTNTFKPVPEDWELDGHKQTDGSLALRPDLDPDSYAKHAATWLNAGATVIGGCCWTRPAHIDRLREMLDGTERLK